MTGKNTQSHLTDVIAGAFLIFFGSAALIVRLDLFQLDVLYSPLLVSVCPIVFIALGTLLWMLEDPAGQSGTRKAESHEVHYGK